MTEHRVAREYYDGPSIDGLWGVVFFLRGTRRERCRCLAPSIVVMVVGCAIL